MALSSTSFNTIAEEASLQVKSFVQIGDLKQRIQWSAMLKPKMHRTGALCACIWQSEGCMGCFNDMISGVYCRVLSGTSMAAPHVVGMAALLLQAVPSATPAEVQEDVLQSRLA